MKIRFFWCALLLLQGCSPGPEDSQITVLGYQKQEEKTLVNLELKLYSDHEPLYFAVDDDEMPVLSLRLDNGLEIEPDIEETKKLARSCANLRYQGLKVIEVTCQVAFKTKQREFPKDLVYRLQETQKWHVEGKFDRN